MLAEGRLVTFTAPGVKKRRGVLLAFGPGPLIGKGGIVLGTTTVAIVETEEGKMEHVDIGDIKFVISNSALTQPEPPARRYDTRIPK